MSKSRCLLFCIMLSLSAHAYAGDNAASVSPAVLSHTEDGLHARSATQQASRQVTLPDSQTAPGPQQDAGEISIRPYGTAASGYLDFWLMLLVAAGLVVLQLRRKQKSLPQRPVADSEKKLFWG